MKRFRNSCIFGVCLSLLMLFLIYSRVKSETLFSDVGLVTKLSGVITYCNDDSLKAEEFMKIYKGDRFKLQSNALIRLVYFSDARQETWKGPLEIVVGDLMSYTISEIGQHAKPEVDTLNVSPRGIMGISSMLDKALARRGGVLTLRGNLQQEYRQKEIEEAVETYKKWVENTTADDITPELFLMGIYVKYKKYCCMKDLVDKALEKRPESSQLKSLKRWIKDLL